MQRALLLASLTLLALTAFRASAQIELPPRIEILDEEPRDYQVGESFKINVDKDALASAGGATHLRLRLFRGTKQSLSDPQRSTKRGGCHLYRSSLYDARDYNGGIQVVGHDSTTQVTFSNDWLHTKADKTSDQHYVMVIEQEGDASGDSILLRTDDVPRYFARGFEFIVEAPQSLRPAEQERLAARAARAAESSFRVLRQFLGLSQPEVATAAGGDDPQSDSEATTAPSVDCMSLLIQGTPATANAAPVPCTHRLAEKRAVSPGSISMTAP